MSSVFVVDACRTPIGKVKGALADVRPDHLAADTLKALIARNAFLDLNTIDDVYWGAANQAGEDNRNVARMAVLLAGLPVEIPGATVNRLCGSGMEAVSDAARAIAAGDADICVAGGTESMTRAPFVVARSGGPVSAEPGPGRHAPWLAPGVRADAGDVPADQSRRDGRERGGQVRHHPGAAGRVGAAQPPAGGRRPRRRPLRRRDRPGDHREGRDHHGRGHQRRHHARATRRQEAGLPQGTAP